MNQTPRPGLDVNVAQKQMNARAQSLLDKEPDYGFWMDREHWKLPEAAKLLCGRDPMARFTGRPKYNTELRVIDIIDRAFVAVQNGVLKGDRSALLPVHVMVEPPHFLRWAQDESLEIPPRLLPCCPKRETQELVGATTMSLNPVDEAVALDELYGDRHLSDIALERALTVAKTLRCMLPDMTIDQLLDHPAQQQVARWRLEDRDQVHSYLQTNL